MKNQNTLLILLPGFPGTPDLMYPFENELNGCIRTHVIGFPNRKMTYDDMIVYAEQKIPRDQPLVILGESYSGPVALALVNRNRHDIRGMILCSTFIKKPHSFIVGKTKYMPLTWMFSRPMPELVGRLLIGEWNMPIEFLRRLWASSMIIDGEVMAHRVRQLSKSDNFPEPQAPDLPVLIMEAADDRLLSPKNGNIMLRAIPHAVYKKIKGPHLLLQLRPKECAKTVLAFIDSL
jgi:pimeloyl-[acyl-carrier protein] methyl ester esterase